MKAALSALILEFFGLWWLWPLSLTSAALMYIVLIAICQVWINPAVSLLSSIVRGKYEKR